MTTLSFISNKDLKTHVNETVSSYKSNIDWNHFHQNIVDPIKMLFDGKIYQRDINTLLTNEAMRQLDKSNNNLIGYFHQNIFKYIGGKDWLIPPQGFDIVNKKKNIFVEMKNKHNTMNSSSSQKTYIKMQNQIIDDSSSTCLLVEILSKKSQNIPWIVSVDGVSQKREQIRKVSIDQFYTLVTGEKYAFRDLCLYLPSIIEEVIEETKMQNGIDDLLQDFHKKFGDNIWKGLFLQAFNTYNGFEEFDIHI